MVAGGLKATLKNIDVTVGDILYVCESVPEDRHRHVVNLYLAGEIRGGEIRVGEDRALVGVEYVPIAELTRLDFRPPVAEQIVEFLQSPGNPRPISLGNRWTRGGSAAGEDTPSR